MPAEIPDPKTIEVANQTPTQTAPKEPEDFSFLNAEPGEFDVLPPDPKASKPAEATATATEPAPAVATRPEHPASLVEAAREAGITDRVMAKLGTDELIEVVLANQAKMNAIAEATAKRSPVRQPKPEPEVDEDDRELADLATEFGEDNKIVRKMRKDHERHKKLETMLTERAKTDALRHQNESYDAIETAFESLGPKFEKLFGKGTINEIADGNKAKRKMVAMAAGIDFNADSPRMIQRKITQAALQAFGDLVADPAPATSQPAKPNGKQITPDQWDQGVLAKPTSAKPPRAKVAANAAIADRMSEMGVYAGAKGGNGDDFDGIPD